MPTSFFDTLFIKKLTSVSKYGLEIFITNNNFNTTKWNSSPFFSLYLLGYSLNSNNFWLLGTRLSYWSILQMFFMHYFNCSTISTCIILYFISMFIPKKLCLLSLTKGRSPKCFFTFWMMSDINYGFLCDSLLSSTYQAIVHCVPSIILFATYMS